MRDKIRAMYAGGFSCDQIAELLNVSIYVVFEALETSGVGGSPWG